MSIANDIINCKMPDFDNYLKQGEDLNNIDEYGFTPLIESIITRQPAICQELIKRGVDINKPDVTGRTALHWAVDKQHLNLTKFLLSNGADPNAYTSAGLAVLVYPILRGHNDIKNLLFQYGAKLDFAQDFIFAKLLGHRFELQGDVDIVNSHGEFIELDYEGFILEFTIAIIKDSLNRFTSSYSTKAWRGYFHHLHQIMDAYDIADELLQIQRHVAISDEDRKRLSELLKSPLLFLPAASQGHAFSFIKLGSYWAKIDRGENSIKEGSVNIYKIGRPDAFNLQFLQEFLYKKQNRDYFHKKVNSILDLKLLKKVAMESQISGNCSWSNIQAMVFVAFILLEMSERGEFSEAEANALYEAWLLWDKDRALDESIQRFYLGDPVRKASIASMLAEVLFQACDHEKDQDIRKAEKILSILTIPEYYYILQSYLEIFCIKRLTRRGNNLLKILDDCGINPQVGVTPIATGLEPRDKR